jgi:hypothetical protein
MTTFNLGLLSILVLIGTSGLDNYAIAHAPKAKSSDCEVTKEIVNKYYPHHILVQLKNLNEDVKKYFATTYAESHPGCTKGDFDGDGEADYALLLRAKIKEKIIERLVVLKGKGGKEFMAINLDQYDERTGDSFLRSVPAGKIKDSTGTEMVTTNHPGFEIVLFEAASRVYFWRAGKFHFIQTSD